ncbi:MAG: periplasmic heavy metal sensor [Tateyamaria sp.]|uniref:periplasmic heavy metal sensor n=1 Tax=Tateyamaria sp. TaxID=1929288 RepID=UPI003274E208
MGVQSDKRRGPAWVKVLLAVSLGLNLAVAGVVAGFVLRGGPQDARRANMGYATPYVLALPRELRREVFGKVRRDGTVPDRSARRANYTAMINALSATPFDANAVQIVLDRQSDGASRAQAAGQTAWLEVVTGFDDAERANYVTRMKEEMSRKGPRRKGGSADK